MTVLVTGATGNVGAHTVRALRARGIPVRAFVRDPAAVPFDDGVEVAAGDFEDAASVLRAMDGVRRLLLSSGDGPRKAEHEAAVVDAARAAGVELIVKASTIGADPASPLPAFAWNGRSEAHLRRSGVPAVVLASCFYMTNLLAAAGGPLVAPADKGRIAMIDPADVGEVAAAVLAGDGQAGQTYHLTGPEAIGYADVAAELSRATGRPVDYIAVPEEAARAELTAGGMPDWLVSQLVGVFRLIRSGALAETTGTVAELTGRAPRSFADFARDHGAAFAARAPAVS